MRREIAPAVHSLLARGLLPSTAEVFGVANDPLDDGSFRSSLSEWVSKSSWLSAESRRKWARSAPKFRYLRGDLRGPEVYGRLADWLSDSRGGDRRGNVIFHLAVPPALFATVVRYLASTGLARGAEGWRRVIFEKPFGLDLPSSRALARVVKRILSEGQVYRMDHFLGKESVQNISTLRFTNAYFEPLWNRKHVDNVQIMVDEALGVEGRGRYYEGVGVIRDMVQNHLFQLVSLVAMDSPRGQGPGRLQAAKARALKSMRPVSPRDVVLGQYRGYRHERGVGSASSTPTYAALRVWIDSPRWLGVPFYLRTGKKMARKATEIHVRFRARTVAEGGGRGNYLVMRVQPDESVRLGFNAKAPGPGNLVSPVEMVWGYGKVGSPAPMEAYERLLYDVARGDQSLFVSSEFEELAWGRLAKIVGPKSREALHVAEYEPGGWGPAEAERLPSADGRSWAVGF